MADRLLNPKKKSKSSWMKGFVITPSRKFEDIDYVIQDRIAYREKKQKQLKKLRAGI